MCNMLMEVYSSNQIFMKAIKLVKREELFISNKSISWFKFIMKLSYLTLQNFWVDLYFLYTYLIHFNYTIQFFYKMKQLMVLLFI
jgi:diketogulonate reductase-like aldo/keto reductase